MVSLKGSGRAHQLWRQLRCSWLAECEYMYVLMLSFSCPQCTVVCYVLQQQLSLWTNRHARSFVGGLCVCYEIAEASFSLQVCQLNDLVVHLNGLMLTS